jgi:hypothetical protein
LREIVSISGKTSAASSGLVLLLINNCGNGDPNRVKNIWECLNLFCGRQATTQCVQNVDWIDLTVVSGYLYGTLGRN